MISNNLTNNDNIFLGLNVFQINFSENQLNKTNWAQIAFPVVSTKLHSSFQEMFYRIKDRIRIVVIIKKCQTCKRNCYHTVTTVTNVTDTTDENFGDLLLI